jgi:S-adenosylmethionine hydrolase
MQPLITLLTDFGIADGYAGIMKGVIYGIAPSAQIIDISHQIAAQDVRGGALVLHSAVPFFPRGSVHVAVVDPGVGSARAPIVIATEAAVFVGPDNGLLAPAVAAQGGPCGCWRIENTAFLRPAVSRTFHGRDIFAPAAAHLALGVRPEEIGPPHAAIKPLPLPQPECSAAAVRGEVIYVDHFGNLISNISADDLKPFATAGLSVSINDVSDVPLVSAYAQGAPSGALAVINSWGLLEVAVRDGHAAQMLSAGAGTRVTVTRSES